MGYVRKRKVFVLSFEDPEYAGLEVRAHSTSLGNLLGMVDLTQISARGFRPEDITQVNDLFALFAGCLISWNLEDEDGKPISFEPQMLEVPARLETEQEAKLRAVKDQDMDFVMSLVMAWMDGVVSTPAPLPAQSNSGERSEVPFLTMEPL